MMNGAIYVLVAVLGIQNAFANHLNSTSFSYSNNTGYDTTDYSTTSYKTTRYITTGAGNYNYECFGYYGASDCTESSQNCSWANFDYGGCGACYPSWYLNSSNNDCDEGYVTMNNITGYVSCSNGTVWYRTSCAELYGNDSSSSSTTWTPTGSATSSADDDDDHDVCQMYGENSTYCFWIDADCVWIEPSVAAQSMFNVSECGVCVNYTALTNTSVDTCVSGDTILNNYGGWYSQCEFNDTNYISSCVNYTDDGDNVTAAENPYLTTNEDSNESDSNMIQVVCVELLVFAMFAVAMTRLW